jgi:multidrug efflux pump subunit AcrA (membrane-fusion protein)
MKTKRLQQVIAGVAVLVLLVAGFLVIRNAKQRSANAPVAKKYPISVSSVKVKQEDVILTLPYLALVQNDQDITISTKLSGRIQFLKSSGSAVSKGEVIARLDNTTLQTTSQSIQSQITAQQVALDNLKATHRRTLELVVVQGASKEQAENEESKIAEAESRIEVLIQTKNDLNNSSTITSPVTGVISKTIANMGDMAMPGMPLAIVSSKTGSYLKLSVPASLKVYGVITGSKTYKAIPLNSTFNGLAEYKVNVDNLNLLSGERVEADVIVYSGSGIKIPFDAILNRNNKSYVFIQENDQATAREVTIVQSGETGVVISNNEVDGKEIILAKQDILLSLLSGVSITSKVKEN